MTTMAIALMLANITAYTSPMLRVYNSECQYEKEVAKGELPEAGKPGSELLPPNGVCNRPSIMSKGKRIWLAPGQVTITGVPICHKVSESGSSNRTGTSLGNGAGGAVCIPVN